VEGDSAGVSPVNLGELRRASQFGDLREYLILPKHLHFTSQSAEDFRPLPDPSCGLVQSGEDASLEGLPESPKTASQNVHNMYLTVLSSTWSEVSKHSSASSFEVHRGVAIHRLSPSPESRLRGIFTGHGAEDIPAALADALEDLEHIYEDAREEGFPEPSATVIQNAECLLKQLFDTSNRCYEVYSMPDGEVAIDAPDGTGQSMLLLCEPAGSVLCLANLKSGHRRARYSTAETLPDDFVREALAKLRKPGH